MSNPNDTTCQRIWLHTAMFAVDDTTGLNVRYNSLVERYEIRIGSETGAWLTVNHPMDLRHVDDITNNWVLLHNTALERRYILKCAPLDELRRIQRQRLNEAESQYLAEIDEARRLAQEEYDRRYWAMREAVQDE